MIKKIFKTIFILSLSVISSFYFFFSFFDKGIINYSSFNTLSLEDEKMKDVVKIFLRNDDNLNTLFKEKEEVTKPIFNEDKPLTDPIIYLYSTHQTEKYQSIKGSLYNVSFGVYEASLILKELLKEEGINILVEDTNISSILKERSWDYSYSYRISRELMEEKKKSYPSLKIFIDLHRDSIKKEYSTTTIDDEDYAKIMFLVGKNRDNLNENLVYVREMESFLNKEYSSILRNTYYRLEYDYNQDFNNYTFLIELGSDKNTLEEVYNSLVAIKNMLVKFLENH